MRPDNAPTIERARRSSFLSAPAIGTEQEPAKAGARMYRSLSTIERLRRDGSISARQAEAGMMLRDDYELGVAGARDAPGGSSSMVGYYYAECRLQALRRYQSAVNAMGERLVRFIHPIACGLPGGGDISIAALAKRERLNRQECTGICKLGLSILADHYGLAPEGA